jgi:GNAT superfamily N-acetyltransferase
VDRVTRTTTSMDGDLEVAEYTEADEAECLRLRNEVFPPISLEDWRRGSTAAVARLSGRVVGVIPFMVRPFQLREDVSVRGAFANSVAVAEDCRGSGVGTAMMQAAAAFLQKTADTMLVYTDDEAEGRPYRFYQATGHADLAYPARYRLAGGPDEDRQPGVAIDPVAPSTVAALEPELLEVFGRAWAVHGGFVWHVRGYYERALSSHIFAELPLDETLIVRVAPGRTLDGYALVGVRRGEACVLEWGWSSPAAEVSVVRSLWGLARERGLEVVTWSCRPPYQPFGGKGWSWVRERRKTVLAGRCIQAETVWAATAGELAGPLHVTVWTPEGTVRLGPEGAPTLSLEMKRWQLEQLLLCRRNLEEDVRAQRITVAAGTGEQVAAVSRALRTAPWECHQLDYI